MVGLLVLSDIVEPTSAFDTKRSLRCSHRMSVVYGPAVRCKPNLIKWRGLVLRICIRPLHGAVELLAIMDIRAHPISFSERP